MSKPDPPITLGIESSCDDTACALLDGAGRVLASVVASQLEPHRPYGGVVPEIASREHLANWPAVCSEALARAGLTLGQVDLVAATRGPGLVGSLLVGLATGKAIAWSLNRPFFGIHHIAGHIFSPFLDVDGAPAHPLPARFVALVVSGGHTSLFEVEGGEPRMVVETRDDAIGEVFDKVGKRLGLPFPQGPVVDRLAEDYGGPAPSIDLPVPKLSRGELFFSYSGLKSATIRHLEAIERATPDLAPSTELLPSQIALLVAFRQAAIGQLVDRLNRLHRERPFDQLAVSGGVAANRLLRRELTAWSLRQGVDLRLVPLPYCGDNAAMIAHVALLRYRTSGRRPEELGDPLDIEAAGRLPVGVSR